MSEPVKEIKIGNALVRFHDDYCRGQTKAEAQEIIQDISKFVCAQLIKQNETA
ncbi:hypothetical protein [Hominifimenecus sp. rT4P-3]|uniref:hypothetical protein n=1 Tax=Hominifimenecus sp. rT4P-3 TaxID=3242979 RepID=UPI003DA4E4B9